MVKYKSEDIFAALGHPVRKELVERLAKEERVSLSELARPFSMSLPAVMKHVSILEENGVVVCKKEGRVKYCAINAEVFASGGEWFREMEKLWTNRLDRLEDYLLEDKK